MPKYLIKYKITTLAQLIKPFSHKEYDFTSYKPEWWKSHAWVASRIVESEHAGPARYKFINDLIPLIDQFSVVSQCSFRVIANSYFVYRQDNNPERRIFIHYVRPVSPTGLHFNDKEIAQLQKFDNLPNKGGLSFIMDAANAKTYYTRLTMLIIAIEGLAGEISAGKTVKTNHDITKRILGMELWNKLYSYGSGLRNKLFHGNIIDHSRFEGLGDEIYQKILAYLKEDFEIEVEENVVHPQRSFDGNFEETSMFMGFKSEPIFDLRIIEEAVDDRQSNRTQESDIFDYLGNPTASY